LKVIQTTRFISLIAVMTGLLTLSTQAYALDIVSGVSLGNKSMQLKIDDREFTPSFVSLDFNITALLGKTYISVSHEQSIKDDIEGAEDESGTRGLIYYSRSDTSLTLGYPVFEYLNIFGGYRQGETSAYWSATSDSFGSSSQGAFLGGSTSYDMGKAGAIGFSLAVANLQGKVSLQEPFVDTQSILALNPDPPSDIEGSAVGYSLGLSWSGGITKDTSFVVAYKLHRYEFEDSENFGGTDLSYEENFSTISVGVNHFF
jgi:hypothetical protein